MTLQNHLVELERKHRNLEKELQSAQCHLSARDEQLAALKRKKLQLKDEMTRVQQNLISRLPTMH